MAAYNQAEVGFHHPFLGPSTNAKQSALLTGQFVVFKSFGTVFRQRHHRLDLIAQFDFFGRGQQWNTADGGQVPADWITAATALGIDGFLSR